MFVNAWGRHYRGDYLRDTWRKASEAAGVRPIQLKNATRASWITQKLDAGIDMWAVSKTIGHSDIKHTEKYTGSLPDKMREIYEK